VVPARRLPTGPLRWRVTHRVCVVRPRSVYDNVVTIGFIIMLSSPGVRVELPALLLFARVCRCIFFLPQFQTITETLDHVTGGTAFGLLVRHGSARSLASCANGGARLRCAQGNLFALLLTYSIIGMELFAHKLTPETVPEVTSKHPEDSDHTHRRAVLARAVAALRQIRLHGRDQLRQPDQRRHHPLRTCRGGERCPPALPPPPQLPPYSS
jgi:hypothetical protein